MENSLNLKAKQYDYEKIVRVESDWDDLGVRNMIFNAVIFDEFLKELAAICQEHSIITK